MSDERDPMDQMRDDWRTVARHRKACGHWTEGDEEEIGREVKAAVAAGNPADGVLVCWRRWLANEAEEIRRWSSRVRDSEARIRAEAKALRKLAA